MKRTLFACLAMGLTAIAATPSAKAFEVQPMRHSLFPTSGKTTSLVTVKNTRAKPLPLEMVLEKRIFTKDGVQTTVTGEDDFLVFPAQAIIAPGATQAFRFQYVGTMELEEETAYTLNVREVPVDLEEGFTGLRYIYNFGVAIYIEDDKAKSDLSVQTVARTDDTIDITFANDSSSFGRLTNDTLTLETGGVDLVLRGEELTSLLDAVVVPPNASLKVSVDTTELDVAAGDIGIVLDETPD